MANLTYLEGSQFVVIIYCGYQIGLQSGEHYYYGFIF